MGRFETGPVRRALRGAILVMVCVVLWAAFAAPSHAAPYIGRETFTYAQPDGSSFPVKLYGDEFFAYERTLDGRQVVKDAKTGFWCYARLSDDGTRFVSTGVPVVTVKRAAASLRGEVTKLGAAVQPNLRLPVAVVLDRVRAAQAKYRVDDRGVPLTPEAEASGDGISPSVLRGPPSSTTTGDIIGLCILVDFPDQEGTMTQAQVDNYCNQKSGYTDFGNACSINEYYHIQSNGKMNFVNVVTAYVRMPKPKTYYDDNAEMVWGSSPAQELVDEALDLLIADDFDFTVLTRDSGGYIKSLNVFYAGTCASGWTKGLWPHKWAIPTKTVDATNSIKASTYQMSDMKAALRIGTFCHENGHMTCDFPDLYSYENGASLVGYYSLMSSGSHGGSGYHPTSVDPYLKMKAGWADIVEIDSSTT